MSGRESTLKPIAHNLIAHNLQEGFSRISRKLNWSTRVLQIAAAVCMTASDVCALYLTFREIVGHNALIALSVVAAGTAFTTNFSFHTKFARKHLLKLLDGELLTGHDHDDEHAGNHDHEPLSSLHYFLYYFVTGIMRIMQHLMSFCRMAVELFTAWDFIQMMHTDSEAMTILEPDNWQAMLLLFFIYLFLVFPYDLLITTAESIEAVTDFLKMHRPHKDYMTSFLLYTLGLPFAFYRHWVDADEGTFKKKLQMALQYLIKGLYYLNMLFHTLIHSPVVVEFLEQLGCERDDMFKPQVFIPTLLITLVALGLIFMTTHHFEGQSVLIKNLNDLLGNSKESEAKISSWLKKVLRVPSVHLAEFLKTTSAMAKACCLLFLVAIFHGLDAWLPVIQAGLESDLSKDMAQFLAAVVAFVVTFTIYLSECAFVRQKCEETSSEVAVFASHNHVAYTVFVDQECREQKEEARSAHALLRSHSQAGEALPVYDNLDFL